jgi:hypothetical protein
MKYFNIEKFDLSIMTSKFIEQCIASAKKNLSNTPEHYSSKSGKPTNLFHVDDNDKLLGKVNSKFKHKPNRSFFLYIHPNHYVAPHTDGKIYKRDTTIIIPLSPDKDNYAGAISGGEEVPYMDCYAFSTQIMHSVKNNDNERISIQLEYGESIEEMYLMYKSGELING